MRPLAIHFYCPHTGIMIRRYIKDRLLAVLIAGLMVGPATAETLVISAARMLDVEKGNVTGPVRVVVRDGMIEAINPQQMPADARVIELGDRTLLPGRPCRPALPRCGMSARFRAFPTLP